MKLSASWPKWLGYPKSLFDCHCIFASCQNRVVQIGEVSSDLARTYLNHHTQAGGRLGSAAPSPPSAGQ